MSVQIGNVDNLLAKYIRYEPGIVNVHIQEYSDSKEDISTPFLCNQIAVE